MKKLIIFLLIATPFMLTAQQNSGVELIVTQSSSECPNGERIAFFDINNDNRFDRLTKFYCDKNYQDFDVETNARGSIDKSMSFIVKKNLFKDNEMIAEIHDIHGDLIAVLLYQSPRNLYSLYFLDKTPDDFSKNMLHINPNPGKDFIEIEKGETDNFNFKIFDESGKDVSNQIKIISDYNQKMKIEVTNLSTGVYLIKIGTKTGKFIKI